MKENNGIHPQYYMYDLKGRVEYTEAIYAWVKRVDNFPDITWPHNRNKNFQKQPKLLWFLVKELP